MIDDLSASSWSSISVIGVRLKSVSYENVICKSFIKIKMEIEKKLEIYYGPLGLKINHSIKDSNL